jgi:hypothetical protein
VAVTWTDRRETEARQGREAAHGSVPVYTSPPLARVEWALVRATNRGHVSVFRPAGEWTLILIAPMWMEVDVLLELSLPYLSADEARVVESGLKYALPEAERSDTLASGQRVEGDDA